MCYQFDLGPFWVRMFTNFGKYGVIHLPFIIDYNLFKRVSLNTSKLFN